MRYRLKMRILAMGDIHGCLRALDTMLAAIQLQPDDLLITLGDYVDRGPDSCGVLRRLLALKQTHRLVALRGNHDQMMLDIRDGTLAMADWLAVGGKATLASYATAGKTGRVKDVPKDHWDFLEKVCVDWYETETHLFVHANAYPDIPLDEQPRYMLLWEQLDDPPPHESGKIMVCGHTSQKSGLPLNLGHAICIDTWVYGAGWLTCLDVGSGRVWQTNQRGQQGTSWIDDYASDI